MAKIGLVLAGGGGKGAYQIGVWKAFREYGLDKKIDVVAGTSVGGLNAALFVQDDYLKAEKIWESITNEELLIRKGRALEKKKGVYLFSNEGLSRLILDNLDLDIVNQSQRKCYLTCKEIGAKKSSYQEISEDWNGIKKIIDGKSTYFALNGNWPRKEMLAMLLATSALPLIFPKVKVAGNYYRDGGLVNNIPIEPLYSYEKCNIIIVVHLRESSFHAVNKSNYPRSKIWEIFPGVSLGGMTGIIDFNGMNAKERIDLGYDETVSVAKNICRNICMEDEVIDIYKECKSRIEDRNARIMRKKEVLRLKEVHDYE